MTRNLGRLRVSYELLESLLRLPAGSIADAYTQTGNSYRPFRNERIVDILVEHPSMPACREGFEVAVIGDASLVFRDPAPPVESVVIIDERQ